MYHKLYYLNSYNCKLIYCTLFHKVFFLDTINAPTFLRYRTIKLYVSNTPLQLNTSFYKLILVYAKKPREGEISRIRRHDPNAWGVHFKFRHVGSHRRRNHPRQIFLSIGSGVLGFRPPEFCYPHRRLVDLMQQCKHCLATL